MKYPSFLSTLSFGLALLLTASAHAQNPDNKSAPAPQSFPGATTEIYKTVGDVKLPIHIYAPEGHRANDQAPAIVFYFGGGWRSGSPQQFIHHCEYLASRGMVAMTVEYRVANRHGVKAVSCLTDAKSAFRWVRENAQRLGIDPDRIAAGGGSAGGHLAAALATISDYDEPHENQEVSSMPNALALYNPAVILAPVEGEETIPAERLSSLRERMGVPLEAFSPYHNLDASLPPTIIFHGTADPTVPYRLVELFTEKAKSLGNSCTLVGYEGQKHGFFNYKGTAGPMFVATLSETDKFLTALGYLSGSPEVETFFKSRP
jgi:acetyl esterase